MGTLREEFLAWDAASDEALTSFEPECPCYGCLEGWGRVYTNSGGRQRIETCHDGCQRYQEWSGVIKEGLRAP